MKLSKLFFICSFFILFLKADDAQYHINYFGNLSINSLDKDGYTYRNYQMDDIDNDLSWTSYSKVGTQLSIYKDDFDFIFQGTARSYDDEVQTDVTWLNIKYYLGDFSFRAGRMQIPLFLNSNSLDVDYVHLWAKAPIEVYGIFPAKSYDGFEILYQKDFNNIYFDLQVTPFGSLKEDVSILDSFGEVEVELDEIRNIVLNIEWNNFIIKSSYTEGKLTIPLDGTGLDTLTQTLNYYGFSDLAEKYSFENKKLKFYAFGIDYTYKKYIFNSEVVKMDSNSFFPNMLSYYVLAGYQWDRITPYIMYAENKNDESHYSVDELSSLSSLQIGLEQQLYEMNSSQKTISIGFRYDYKKGIAFKTQLDRITTTDYGDSTLSGEYERLGFLAREKGIEDEPVYMGTVSVSFAF